MTRFRILYCVCVAWSMGPLVWGGEETAAPSAKGQAPALALFDTGKGSAEAWSGAQLAERAEWVAIPPGEKAAFKGDAVVQSGALALVLRKGASGAELYGQAEGGWAARGRLVPLGAGLEEAKLAGCQLQRNEKAALTLEAAFEGKGGKAAVRFELELGQGVLKTGNVSGAEGLRLEAQTRLAVLPDFFSDDIVIDARTIPVDRTELPADNLFMALLGNGESIAVALWDKSKRDLELRLSGEKEARMLGAADFSYGEGGSIWFALLEQKGIWAQQELNAENVKKVLALDWKVPFRAKWKGNFLRVDRTVDSWEFSINPASRGGWSGVVGGYEHPCWLTGKDELKAQIQAPTKFPNGNFAGPFVTYPIDRTSETPLDRLTITDLMRNSLGTGPCEYIMDVAGQGVSSRGIYTCSVEHTLPLIYDFGLQKEERPFVENMLVNVQIFVKAIQDRINSYVEFRQATLKYLEEQKKANPALADFLGRLEAQTKRIQEGRANGSVPVAQLVAQIRAGITEDLPKGNWHQLASAIAGIGLGQDNAVARCRQSVKVLRQMAAIEMAVDPKAAEVAKEMKKRTQQILRNPFGHEMR